MIPAAPSMPTRQLCIVIVSVAAAIVAGCGSTGISLYGGFAGRIAMIDRAAVVVDLTFQESMFGIDTAVAKARGHTLVETAVDAFLYRGYPVDQGELISDEKDPNLKASLLSLVAKLPPSYQTEPDTLLFPDAIPIGATLECSAIFVLRAHMDDPGLVEHAVHAALSKVLIGTDDDVFDSEISLMLSIIDTRDGMLLWNDIETREFKEITVESVSQVVSVLVRRIPRRH